ncbi:MAG: hypothetical protein E7E92_00735, partial [Clostridiales bacterium]|nr:hypothetical protein [Clostridiales bacterium]
MEFRKSTKSDVTKIMEIVKQAQEYFKSQGIDQWQNGYPNEEVINKLKDNLKHISSNIENLQNSF